MKELHPANCLDLSFLDGKKGAAALWGFCVQWAGPRSSHSIKAIRSRLKKSSRPMAGPLASRQKPERQFAPGQAHTCVFSESPPKVRKLAAEVESKEAKPSAERSHPPSLPPSRQPASQPASRCARRTHPKKTAEERARCVLAPASLPSKPPLPDRGRGRTAERARS